MPMWHTPATCCGRPPEALIMQTDILIDNSAIEVLADPWDRLVRDSADPVTGLDATAGSVWLAALKRAHLREQEVRTVVVREGAAVLGLLPVVHGPPTAFGRRLYMAAQPYCGRAAPILGDADAGVRAALLNGLDQACPGWASLDVVLTQDSPMQRWLQSCGGRFDANAGASVASPYFALGPTAEAFWAACSKSTRQQVRTSRNKLEAAGRVELKLITGGDSANRLIDDVLAIERASWKHDSGTAITRHPVQEAFYRAWFPLAADAGQLVAAMVCVDGRPVAHNFGFLRDGVYCCLKHSHDQGFDKASPVYPLTAFLIDELMARGAHTFDYMGVSEPHKWRWSPDTRTYTRIRGRLYRDSARGQALAALDRLRDRARQTVRGWGAKSTESVE